MPKTQTVPLNFESLHSLGDGELGVLFRNQLLRIARDCIDRPNEKTKRKVVIEVITLPVCNSKGEFTHCDVEIECKAKIPTYRSAPYQMAADANGFRFNRDFPDAIDQLSLLEDGDGDDA